jgi:hypothetical protein
MATIFYIRKGSKKDNIASSRDVSVEDLRSLYGSAPSTYQYMEGVSSPYINIDQEPASTSSDPDYVVVKIERNEVNQDTFPYEGFYRVNVNTEKEY